VLPSRVCVALIVNLVLFRPSLFEVPRGQPVDSRALGVISRAVPIEDEDDDEYEDDGVKDAGRSLVIGYLLLAMRFAYPAR
jgi:hypothetical protein